MLIAKGGDSGQLEAPLSQISVNSARIAEIVRSVRQMIKSGEAKKEPFLLQTLLRETGSFMSAIKSTGVQLRYRISGGALLMGDPIHIQQVLINLIRNSCEAVRGSANEQVVVFSTVEDGVATVGVEDIGPE